MSISLPRVEVPTAASHDVARIARSHSHAAPTPDRTQLATRISPATIGEAVDCCGVSLPVPLFGSRSFNERPLCARSGRSITAHYANPTCRRQIEKSPLAQIEMSLSTVLVGEFWADDGDCDEPDGDRPDERVAGSGCKQDQSNGSRDADEPWSASGVPTGQGLRSAGARRRWFPGGAAGRAIALRPWPELFAPFARRKVDLECSQDK